MSRSFMNIVMKHICCVNLLLPRSLEDADVRKLCQLPFLLCTSVLRNVTSDRSSAPSLPCTPHVEVAHVISYTKAKVQP